MREVKVEFTVLDVIEVPDDFTDEEITERAVEFWYNNASIPFNDLEWD